MITLCLTLAPERKKVELEDNATLEDLYKVACSTFGIAACTLRHGYPSVALPLLLDDNTTTTKTTLLSTLKIQNQDRITVTSSAAASNATAMSKSSTTTTFTKAATIIKQKENKTPSSAAAVTAKLPPTKSKPSNTGYIPGLTRSHYIKDSRNAADPPTRILCQVNGTSFQFRWKASGSNASSYQVSAEGNLLNQGNGSKRLTVKCTCPAFTKMGRNPDVIPTKVCKHLAAALDNALDPTAQFGGSNNKTVDLLSDSDTDVDDGVVAAAAVNQSNPKRKSNESNTQIVKKVKKKHAFQCQANIGSGTAAAAATASSTATSLSYVESPIKLLATPQDLQLRHGISDRSHGCWSQCKTLCEMVFGDDATSNVQWMVLSNYLVDFDYLQSQLPDVTKIPRVVIFHSQHQSSPRNWPVSVDFVQLNPGADAQSVMNPLKYRFDYGTHHTKLFLVGYSNKIRVVVSTANLRPGDSQKAQAAYIEEFPLATNAHETSDFEDTLVRYMSSYGYMKKRSWLGQNRESLIGALAHYDYSSAKAVLIPSIPGYHGIDNRTPRMGQLKLRQAIQNYTVASTSSSRPRPVVCQFSSIGSLSEKYLHAIQTSMDTCLARSGERGNSLQLKFVYPTVEEIRTSVEGYTGGDSVPGRKKAVSKPILRPLWHTWSSRSSISNSSNKLTKPNNVPHIKSYYQTNSTNDGFDWLVITSHNISQTAWGTIGDNRHGGGQRLYIRSWELGVFVSPQTLGVDKLTVWSGQDKKGGGRTATVPMPYLTHSLERYSSSDQPWACDEQYLIPDRFGFRSCMG